MRPTGKQFLVRRQTMVKQFDLVSSRGSAYQVSRSHSATAVSAGNQSVQHLIPEDSVSARNATFILARDEPSSIEPTAKPFR
jgi:hypothetical protein